MIIDKIENLHIYRGIHLRVEQVIEYLKIADFSKMSSGKYVIDGDKLFVLVNEYATKDYKDCILEAHKKYIDFQYMLSGCEQIGYVPLSDQKITKEYDSENDYALFQPENLSLFNLSTGVFALLFPEDLHMPGIMCNKSESIKKIVIKILI